MSCVIHIANLVTLQYIWNTPLWDRQNMLHETHSLSYYAYGCHRILHVIHIYTHTPYNIYMLSMVARMHVYTSYV